MTTPDLTPVSYDRALRIVCEFTEGLSSESPEYERGQLEMLADMFPAANVETDCRMTQIAREIRAMYAADTAAMRRVDTTAPNDLADMSVQSAAEYLTALVEDGCTGYVQPADGHIYIHHTGDTCPIHETGSPITVELTEEQLRAALDVIALRVSETNEQGTPLFRAERVLDSALMAHEQTEGGS